MKIKRIVAVLTLLFLSAAPGFSDEKIPGALVLPPVQGYKDTAKNLKRLQVAILDYIYDNQKAPEAESITQLMDQDVGNGLTFAEFFLDEIDENNLPIRDAWGKDFLYKYDQETFYIASPGCDGTFEGFDQMGYYLYSELGLSGQDLIVSQAGLNYFPFDKKELKKYYIFFQIFYRGLHQHRLCL